MLSYGSHSCNYNKYDNNGDTDGISITSLFQREEETQAIKDKVQFYALQKSTIYYRLSQTDWSCIC